MPQTDLCTCLKCGWVYMAYTREKAQTEVGIDATRDPAEILARGIARYFWLLTA